MIKIINGDSALIESQAADLIVADPPFEMKGNLVYDCIVHHNADHVLLFASMRQILEFAIANKEFNFNLNFVFSNSTPHKSSSFKTPHYTHFNVLYLTRNGAKSAFDRRLASRSDVFKKGYYPSIFNANASHVGYGKDIDAVKSLIQSFSCIETVIDMFSGTGSVIEACRLLDLNCIAIEKDKDKFDMLCKKFKIRG